MLAGGLRGGAFSIRPNSPKQMHQDDAKGKQEWWHFILTWTKSSKIETDWLVQKYVDSFQTNGALETLPNQYIWLT